MPAVKGQMYTGTVEMMTCILHYLDDNNYHSTTQIANGVEISPQLTYYYLKRLEYKSIIVGIIRARKVSGPIKRREKVWKLKPIDSSIQIN